MAPGGVPPSPQPLTHPAIDPGPFWRRGLPLWAVVEKRQREWNSGAALAIECVGALPHAGLASAPGWRTSPFGTKPGAFLSRSPGATCRVQKLTHDFSAVVAVARLG